MSSNDEAATQSMPAAQNQTHPNTIALHPRRMRTLKRVCVRAAVAVPPIAAAGAGICSVRRLLMMSFPLGADPLSQKVVICTEKQ